MSNSTDIIRSDILGTADKFRAVLSDKSLNFEAEAGFAMQSLMASDYAMNVAMRNRQSVINAVVNVAAIGISLNPALKQAYLVPRDGKICLDISYMGLMHLAMQSGAVAWVQCAVVCEKDQFELVGLDSQPRHTFNPFAKDRGQIIGVYTVAKTPAGDYLTHTMTIGDVIAIRDKSQAWLAYQDKKTKSCIWADHETEMIRKTCVKQAHKYWPVNERSGRLEAAIHHLNTEAGEGIEQEPPRRSVSFRATDGAMESLSPVVQEVIRELASEVELIWKMDGEAVCFDTIKAKNLDEQQATALWSLLPADMRTAMKKEGEGRRAAAALAGGK